MILRAWMVWGVLAVLVNSVGMHGKPPDSSTPQSVDGTATPIITQTYFQPEPGPSPRLLPTPEVLPAVFPQPKRVLPLPIAAPTDPDAPIRASFMGRGNWQAETAFSIAEMNLEAGEIEEATRWYEEVIKQAPDSARAREAADRLSRTNSGSK